MNLRLTMENMTDDKAEALLVAARSVVTKWAKGDLASAVRELAYVLGPDEGNEDEFLHAIVGHRDRTAQPSLPSSDD